MVASDKGDLARVRELAALGASVNARDVLYETPLLKAAFHDHADVAEFLVKQRAELEMRSMNYNRTALLLAIDRSATATMELLIARKAAGQTTGAGTRRASKVHRNSSSSVIDLYTWLQAWRMSALPAPARHRAPSRDQQRAT